MKKIKKIFLRREAWSHKGDYGYLLIVAGSKKYTGSAIFNAVSALRSGVDLVVCVGPQRAMDIASSFLPDIISHPLRGDYLRKKHASYILKISKKFDALLIGSGLGTSLDTFELVFEVIKGIEIPMVIDGDGIKALKNKIRFLREIFRKKKVVLTPNSKEFEILTDKKLSLNLDERQAQVKKWAQILGAIILLKGHFDVISDGQEVFLNQTGSVYMTKGGFGDTLAGIVASFLAQKIEPFKAAVLGAYINGEAGRLASKTYKQTLLASDIFDYIAQLILRKIKS